MSTFQFSFALKSLERLLYDQSISEITPAMYFS